MSKDSIIYWLIRTAIFPIQWMPYTWIHKIGKVVGRVGFHLLTNYRKRTLSNLSLAKDLNFTNKQILETAIESFQNIAINCLEYPALSMDPLLNHVICENPEVTEELHAKGQGIIFFCAHQANWEVLFLDGTKRMRGIAIGKSIKNKRLYDWILKIREKNGGRIVPVKNALKEGLRALKSGAFLGVVGDQGMPSSGYSYPFLGRTAWTSTAPALLAYKTNSPIIFAEIQRTPGKYQIHYSDPIWPNLEIPLEKEVIRMMDTLLDQLQKSVQKNPGQWFWQHNRWKQQTPKILPKEFRQDCVCVILPFDPTPFLEHLTTLRELYPTDFFVIMAPPHFSSPVAVDEIITYNSPSELLRQDYRFKLIFNLTSNSVRKHYMRLSAFRVLDLRDLKTLAKPHLPIHYTPTDLIKRALCRNKEPLCP